MPGLFSPSSTSIAAPSAFNTGFSEIAGPASSVNVNITGKTKLKKGATLQPIVQFTDQGAIEAASAIAARSLAQVESFSAQVGRAIEQALSAVQKQSSVAIEAVSAAERPETENIALTAIKWGALVAGGFFLFRAITGSRA